MSQLLTAKEAAERLRVSRWTVYDLVRDGVLFPVRLRPRGKLLFTPQSLERAVRQAEAAPAGA